MENLNNDLVSIIIRTTGNDRFAIEKAIFSIYCNTYSHKEIIVVYQGTDAAFLQFLNHLAKIYDTIEFNIINNPTVAVDQRSKNLNIGIKNAKGRYIGFLDDDDQIAQEHIEILVNLINKQGVVWAYSDCCTNIVDNEYIESKKYPFRHDSFSYNNLMVENYIPLHSFLIDTKKILDKRILTTDENLTRMEDYYLLLNLASLYRPFHYNEVTCFYNIKTDGSNSNSILMSRRHHKASEWKASSSIIEDLKIKLGASGKQNLIGYNFSQNKFSRKLRQLMRNFFFKKIKLLFQIFLAAPLPGKYKIIFWIQLVKKL